MNQKVKVNGTTVTITDKHYKAAGGEASIYVNGGTAFKLYHDARKTISQSKIQELGRIANPNVVIPQHLIFDSSGSPIGFTTQFIDNVEPLLKLFTRTFKDLNGIDPKMIGELVKQMQMITTDIHNAQCLIVDYNELNVLVHINNKLVPYYIDVDSYATPSFKATAIMDSVRDRRVSAVKNGTLHYNPDILSDWFSWGVLAFYLYTNIHPYRGSHPKYRPRDKAKQMDDGISVFHKDVRVPPTANDFSVIPKRHLDWFKDTFGKNQRSIPPLPDGIVPVAVPAAIVTVKGNATIDVTQISSYAGKIIDVYWFMGVPYIATKTHVYVRDREVMPVEHARRTLFCASADGTVVAAKLQGSQVTFYEVNTNKLIGSIAGTGMFARNNCIYTIANGKLTENSFNTLSTKILHRPKEVENLSVYSSTVYDGCVIQDLLGRKYLTIPYTKGASFSKHLHQLDGHRVVDAKSDKTVTVIVTEKGGIFYRFIVTFKSNYGAYMVREVKDIAYDTINFAVNDSGLCVLLASATELELFVDDKAVQIINDPPFDSTMRLFSTADGFFFINNNSIHQIKKK